MLKNSLLLSAAAISLGACATTPNVTYRYYPAKSLTTFSVAQTVDCTKDEQSLIVVTTPQSPSTVYSADTTQAPNELVAPELGGNFADSSVDVALLDDGRLKSINTSWTGKGQEIVNAALTVVSAAAKLGAGEGQDEKKPASEACAFVENWGKDNQITLTYSRVLDLSQNFDTYSPGAGGNVSLLGSVSDPKAFGKLKDFLPKSVQVHLEPLAGMAGGATYDCDAASRDAKAIRLRKTALSHLEFRVDSNPAAYGDVIVPVEGKTGDYCLAVPKAQWFGGGEFALELAESGAISSLKYGQTNGGADALTTTGTVITAVMPAAPAAPPPGGSTPP